jgi:Arc/MetJ-type ribon-helix-helix transcriptional regulator
MTCLDEPVTGVPQRLRWQIQDDIVPGKTESKSPNTVLIFILFADINMSKAKIAITLEEETLEKVNRLIKLHVFPNRSRAIQEAMEEKIERLEKNRLEIECAKLDQFFERALAEEGLSEDLAAWPEY